MQKSSTMFPSGPKKKLVSGLFNFKPTNHKPPKAVARAKAEAHSGPPRKNGQA